MTYSAFETRRQKFAKFRRKPFFQVSISDGRQFFSSLPNFFVIRRKKNSWVGLGALKTYYCYPPSSFFGESQLLLRRRRRRHSHATPLLLTFFVFVSNVISTIIVAIKRARSYWKLLTLPLSPSLSLSLTFLLSEVSIKAGDNPRLKKRPQKRNSFSQFSEADFERFAQNENSGASRKKCENSETPIFRNYTLRILKN